MGREVLSLLDTFAHFFGNDAVADGHDARGDGQDNADHVDLVNPPGQSFLLVPLAPESFFNQSNLDKSLIKRHLDG